MDLSRDVTAVTGSTPEKMRKVNLFETPRFFCDVYVLAAGQSQSPHAHEASDKVYVGLSGRGTATVGDRRFDLGAGTAILCPAGAPHSVSNAGPDDLRLLVFMAPHPKPKA